MPLGEGVQGRSGSLGRPCADQGAGPTRLQGLKGTPGAAAVSGGGVPSAAGHQGSPSPQITLAAADLVARTSGGENTMAPGGWHSSLPLTVAVRGLLWLELGLWVAHPGGRAAPKAPGHQSPLPAVRHRLFLYCPSLVLQGGTSAGPLRARYCLSGGPTGLSDLPGDWE